MTIIYTLTACAIAYGAYRLVRYSLERTGPGLNEFSRGPIRSIHG